MGYFNKVNEYFEVFFKWINILSVIITIVVFFTGKSFPDFIGVSDSSPTIENEIVNAKTKNQNFGKTTNYDSKNKFSFLPKISKRGILYGTIFPLFIGIFCAFIGICSPSIFPMIPLVVSYFVKKEQTSKLRQVLNALIYYFSIVFLFSLILIPIFLLDNVESGTYDMLYSNLWINIFFLFIALIFALGLLGVYELNLPITLSHYLDRKADDSSGFISYFFMAFTLVVVSFSRSAPIVSLLIIHMLPFGKGFLIKSILSFSVVIGIPFLILSVFPSFFNKIPKAGKWMIRVQKIAAIIAILFSTRFVINIFI